MKTCAVKASVSLFDGDKAEEEVTGGTEEVDPFAVVVLIALLKLAVGILHPNMASNAVGALVGRVALFAGGAIMLFA